MTLILTCFGAVALALGGLSLAIALLRRQSSRRFLQGVHAYASLAYLLMGAFWVADRPMGRFIPLTGTVAGTAALVTIAPFVILLVFPLVWVLPHVVLALHLVRFHIYGQDRWPT